MSRLPRMLAFASSFTPPLPSVRAASPPRIAATSPARYSRPHTRTTMSASEEGATATAHDVVSALAGVRARVEAAAAGRAVQLVAVSKTKPTSLVRAAYDAGQRAFGENYVQELVRKAGELPGDVAWHFIGPLQTNKAKALAGLSNLAVVESVDREKVAAALDRAVGAAAAAGKHASPLRVMVQVNTSGEDSKAGCVPGATAALARFVADCDHLVLHGLMTIGAPDLSDEPAAFRLLAAERDAVARALDIPPTGLALSMGMSADFEAAIRMGSDSVRVGSTIFGAREYPKQ